MLKSPLVRFGFLLVAILLLTLAGPVEKTLGANARLVYLHGAWVWTALLCFLAASLAGLAGLISRQSRLHAWSRALGRTGLTFWLTFLPMSRAVMQSSWNGLFLSEPRFRIPLNFAIIGLLLQAGLAFLPLAWSSAGNLGFGIALWLGMNGIQAVLHPEAPIFSSPVGAIQLFFGGLLVLLLLAAWQLALWWKQLDDSHRQGLALNPAGRRSG